MPADGRQHLDPVTGPQMTTTRRRVTGLRRNEGPRRNGPLHVRRSTTGTTVPTTAEPQGDCRFEMGLLRGDQRDAPKTARRPNGSLSDPNNAAGLNPRHCMSEATRPNVISALLQRRLPGRRIIDAECPTENTWSSLRDNGFTNIHVQALAQVTGGKMPRGFGTLNCRTGFRPSLHHPVLMINGRSMRMIGLGISRTSTPPQPYTALAQHQASGSL